MAAAETWEKEKVAPTIEPINWAPEVIALRETLNPIFSLPEKPFSPRGMNVDFCAAPGSDLSVLDQPIPQKAEKAATSAVLMLQLINGKIGQTPIGYSMADGEGLPLAVILAVFNGQKKLYSGTKYFHSLQSLCRAIARQSNRYCYFDPKTQTLNLMAEPFNPKG
jgi:hypothetical protein